jgi:hypothetical protein
MKCPLEQRIKSLSRRIRKLNKKIDNNYNNIKRYYMVYGKAVSRNREKKLKMMYHIFYTYKSMLKNLRIGTLKTFDTGKSKAPRHIPLLTRTQRKKLNRILNRDDRYKNDKSRHPKAKGNAETRAQ